MPDALDPHVKALRSILACVTDQRLLVQPTDRFRGAEVACRFRDIAPIRVAEPLRGASISVRLLLRGLDDGSTAGTITDAYSYALLDRGGSELLVYHHHVETDAQRERFPHLHVSAALRPALPNGDRALLPLDKLHLATGPVPLAAFIRTLIEEFGARPLAADWRERLGGSDV